MPIVSQVITEGLAMPPSSYVRQEYPEMKSHDEIIHDRLFEESGERVQMLAWVCKGVGPSLRWPLKREQRKANRKIN